MTTGLNETGFLMEKRIKDILDVEASYAEWAANVERQEAQLVKFGEEIDSIELKAKKGKQWAEEAQTEVDNIEIQLLKIREALMDNSITFDRKAELIRQTKELYNALVEKEKASCLE